jgi:response regulator RpfG family c-di-GMP phosphodiesterase
MNICKVLLIDDDEDSNFLNSWMIKKEITQDILIEQSAIKAIEYLEQNSELSHSLPDLILLDIRMPILDGFGFLKRFENLSLTVREKCRIVILTSSFDRDDYERAVANPYVSAFINKPLTADHILKLQQKAVKP